MIYKQTLHTWPLVPFVSGSEEHAECFNITIALHFVRDDYVVYVERRRLVSGARVQRMPTLGSEHDL